MGSKKDIPVIMNPIPYSFTNPFSVHGVVSQALGLDKKATKDKGKGKKEKRDE